MLKRNILSGLLFTLFITGCGETTYREDVEIIEQVQDEQKEDENPENLITNGIQDLALQKGDIKIYAFVMSDRGYVTIETDSKTCRIELLSERGKLINNIPTYHYRMNTETPKGTNFIKVESINEDCHRFTLFSPMILDDYTNENKEIITNGEYLF